MTKEEYIIAVIDCFPDWEMGKEIRTKVLGGECSEHTINMLVIIFKRVMNEITAQIKENRLLEKIEYEKDKHKLIEDLLKTLSNNDVFTSVLENGIESKSSCAKNIRSLSAPLFLILSENEKR